MGLDRINIYFMQANKEVMMLKTVDVQMVVVNNHPNRIILMVDDAIVKKLKEHKEVDDANGI